MKIRRGTSDEPGAGCIAKTVQANRSRTLPSTFLVSGRERAGVVERKMNGRRTIPERVHDRAARSG